MERRNFSGDIRMNLNKVFIGGRLGGDPEIRMINEDTKPATFSIAVNGWKNKKTGEIPTTWFRCKAFSKADSAGGPANTAERFLRKGGRVFVEAEFSLDSWTDKKSGDKIEAPVFIARRIDIIDFPEEEQSEQPQHQTRAAKPKADADWDDPIPF
jgi:single stranded DNA-binding protein